MTAHYVYRCYDRDGALLYVGQTKDAVNRLAQHRQLAFWSGEVVHVKVTAHRSSEIARAIERRAIHDEHPRFNNQGRWVTRHSWTEQQYVDFARTLLQGSCTDNRLKNVFREYMVKFGQPHPLAEQCEQMFAERERTRAVARKLRRATDQVRHLESALEDAKYLARHLAECELCANDLTTDHYNINCGVPESEWEDA